MQESVTTRQSKRNKKSALKPVIFGCLFFFIIFLISAILVVSKRSNLCFLPRSYFVVYAQKDKNSAALLDLQKTVQDLGGAGVVFENNTEFFVVVAIYTSRDDAKSVADGLKGSFSQAGVKELYAKGVSKKYQNLIKENTAYFELYQKLEALQKEYEKHCLEFISGKLSEGKFLSFILAHKLDIEKQIDRCEELKVQELDIIVHSAKQVCTYTQALFDKFFSAKSKQSVSLEFLVKICLNFIEICDNLQ